jgi:hypothetical protein
MISTVAEAGPAMWAGVIVMGVVALVPPLVWLAGLALALRKSVPADRAEILRAYGTLRLPAVKVGHRETGQDGVDADRLPHTEKTSDPSSEQAASPRGL